MRGSIVAIGQDTGADGNTLQVDGTVTANQILIGASGSKDNILKLDSGGTIAGATLRLTRENFLSLQGDFTSSGSLLTRLGTSTLQVWDGDSWEMVTNANQASLLSRFSSGGVTTFATLLPLPNSAWRVIHFGAEAADPLVSGWTADPDQDGISNLLERAFNLPPRQAGVATLPAATGNSGMPLDSLVPGDVPLLSIEYVRLKAAANTGFIYTPQFSSLPESVLWSAANGVETVESIDETWERVKISDTIHSSPDRRFGRVKVESP